MTVDTPRPVTRWAARVVRLIDNHVDDVYWEEPQGETEEQVKKWAEAILAEEDDVISVTLYASITMGTARRVSRAEWGNGGA